MKYLLIALVFLFSQAGWTKSFTKADGTEITFGEKPSFCCPYTTKPDGTEITFGEKGKLVKNPDGTEMMGNSVKKPDGTEIIIFTDGTKVIEL